MGIFSKAYGIRRGSLVEGTAEKILKKEKSHGIPVGSFASHQLLMSAVNMHDIHQPLFGESLAPASTE